MEQEISIASQKIVRSFMGRDRETIEKVWDVGIDRKTNPYENHSIPGEKGVESLLWLCNMLVVVRIETLVKNIYRLG